MKRTLIFFAALSLFAVLAMPGKVSAQDRHWRHRTEVHRNYRQWENRHDRRRVMIRNRFYSPNNRYRVVNGRRVVIGRRIYRHR
jgi:hypothetical protein